MWMKEIDSCFFTAIYLFASVQMLSHHAIARKMATVFFLFSFLP